MHFLTCTNKDESTKLQTGLCRPFPFVCFLHTLYKVCFLHSMERTLLMDTGQLKLTACLRSSCCSTSTLHRCPQQLPAGGFLPKDSSQQDRGPGALRVRGSGKWSWLQWKHSIHCFPSSGNSLPSLEKCLLLSGKGRTNPARPCHQDLWLFSAMTEPSTCSQHRKWPALRHSLTKVFFFILGGLLFDFGWVFSPKSLCKTRSSAFLESLYKLVDLFWPWGSKANFSINLL